MIVLGHTYETAQTVRQRLRAAALAVSADLGDGAETTFIGTVAPHARVSLGERNVSITACKESVGRWQEDSLFAGLDRYVWLLDEQGLDGAEFAGPAADRTRLALGEPLTTFNELEMADIVGLNPMIYCVAKQVGGAGLAGGTVIIRDHALLEKLNLVRALLSCGVRADDVWFLSKPDDTKYRERTLNSMRKKGINVVESADPKDFAHVFGRVFENPDSGDPDRVLVVDDGGEFIEYVLDSGLERTRFGLVETTAKGMKLLSWRGYDKEVVNLADCRIKERLSRAIASSCVSTFWRLMAHEPLDAQWCHVIGFGRVGSQVAVMLRALGMNVSVAEPRADRRHTAITAGFLARESVKDCLRDIEHRYIFGCSGESAMGPVEMKLLGRHTVLASISSQDFRRMRTELESDGAELTCLSYGDAYVTSDGRKMVLLGDGHAINLYRSEGVPEPDFDAFCALVLGVCLEMLTIGTPTDPVTTLISPDVVAERLNLE